MNSLLFLFLCTLSTLPKKQFCVCVGTGAEPVMCAELCGDCGGASSSGTHSVLLQALQRPGPLVPGRQHRLRLQGQPGPLPAGLLS